MSHALDLVQSLTIPIGENQKPEEWIALLERCASTALNSKLLSGHSAFFAKMVVQAVLKLEGDLDLDLLGMKKEPGGSVEVRWRWILRRKL